VKGLVPTRWVCWYCNRGMHWVCFRSNNCQCKDCPKIAAYRFDKRGHRHPLVELPLQFEGQHA
jgi:hypothetical protein